VLFVPAEARLFVAHASVPAPEAEYQELDLRQIW
jgi:hypothetical protein